jgi:radical SAM superfamily enzyme YgiQ (UPF0313 family)
MWSPLAINLEYIASSIESEVDEIMIVDHEFDNTPILDRINKFKPDFVGVSMSATEHDSGLEVCRIAKKEGITTAVGGYHPTAIPDELLKNPQVDMVFVGESELTMKEYVKKGSPVDVKGIVYKEKGEIVHNPIRPLIEDLDTLPYPARHLRRGDECDRWLGNGLGHRDQIHTSRGCWGKCTFCCEPSMSRSVQRYRKVEKVMNEIKTVYKLHNEEKIHILFGDPHLIGKTERVDRLCDLIIDADMNATFTAMVRADTIAQNPKTVKKMVDAGIIGYCMGLESPGQVELNNTKKGITAKTQMKAVQLLRDNHAVAGGTFIIGLPGQTEEEIKTFPEYARNLGMINAAFAVVTPQAGTEFYHELNSNGLIHDRDWTKYDQMHSVFTHDNISKERLEELLTHCMGRFYAPDIFLDDIIEGRLRINQTNKMTLRETINHLRDRFRFVMSAGATWQPEEGAKHGVIFLKAQINPHTKLRTQEIGIHNMIQLDSFLKIFGNQKIQITVMKKGEPFVHYVLKTTKKKVEYLDICAEPHQDATLNLALDIYELKTNKTRILKEMVKNIIKRNELGSALRAVVAIIVDHIKVTKSYKKTSKMELSSNYRAGVWCGSDSWDFEDYKNLKLNSKTGKSNHSISE